MRTLLALFLLSLTCMLNSCKRELSCENCIPSFPPPFAKDTLPNTYTFSNGYCSGGSSLGVNAAPADSARYSFTDILPDSLVLDVPIPGDQQSQESCSAWATVYAAGSFYFHILSGKPYADSTLLSPAFTYNQISKGNCHCTSITDHLYLLQNMGANSMKDMTYDHTQCSLQPDSLQKDKATKFKIQKWYEVDLSNIALIKQQIFHQMPVIFGASIDDAFKHPQSPYLLSQNSGASGSGHALLICGYDEKRKAFRILNSWSSKWADGGFIWIGYDYFLKMLLDKKGYLIAY